jgi:hypothetical protein
MAEETGLTARRIRQIMAATRVDGSGWLIPLPVQGTDVDDDIKPLLEWSPDAFEAFHNRFSGKVMPPHVKPWIAAFMRERNLILNVPPRHAKSYYFSVWLPLWLICRDRNTQIMLVSKTRDLAVIWARAIADQMTLNRDLLQAFGRFMPDIRGEFPWKPQSGELMVMGRTRETKGAQLTVQSRGSGQQVLGMEADFVIVDDPTDSKISESPTERERHLQWLREEVLTRLQPGGRAVVIGQRVHLHDLYGELSGQVYQRGPFKGQRLWHVERYPAILRWPAEDPDHPEAEVLWPADYRPDCPACEGRGCDDCYVCGWSFEELMVSYERVGGHAAFEMLFQQNPLPEGAGLIRREWAEACFDPNRPAHQGMRPDDPNTAMVPIVRVLSVDPSPTRFHGIVLGDLAYNRNEFAFTVMQCRRVQAGGLRSLTSELRTLVGAYQPDYLIFEESSFSKWFYEDPIYEQFKEQVRTIQHKTHLHSKHHAEYGVQSLAGDFEFRRLSFPYGDAEGRHMTEMLVQEALEYPAGEYDDILMALWFVKFNWRMLVPTWNLPTRQEPGQRAFHWRREDLGVWRGFERKKVSVL